jgi:hypothetical protein
VETTGRRINPIDRAQEIAQVMIRTLALALILFAGVCPAQADGFRLYSNPRFGATAEVPSEWRADPPPENGDGQIFRSPDGRGSLTISGILRVEATPEEAMKEEELPSEGENIAYHTHGRRLVVVSGFNGDKIFYRKSLLVCGDRIWSHIYLEYPAAQKTDYDAIVAHIAQSLRFSGVSAQIPNCR